jgi:Glycosyl transferase family 2
MIPPRPNQALRGQQRRPELDRRRFRPGRALRALLRHSTRRYILYIAALWSGRHLNLVAGPSGPALPTGVAVVAVYRDGPHLVAPFLTHHRRLGIEEFVFLDLSEYGDLIALLDQETDCAVWQPHRPRHPNQEVNWLNFLRHRYCNRRWCLSLETSDLFVFHRCETRRIQSLLDFVGSEHRDHVYALVIDMYADAPAAELTLKPGADPLQLLCYFDPIGYMTSEPGSDKSVTVRGGLRRRAQFAAMPGQSPPLDRVPLVKWRRFYAYVEDTRRLHPNRLNTPHSPLQSSPTACLLRLALLADNDTGCSGGSRHVSMTRLRADAVRIDSSRRYTGSEGLVDSGLLNPGQWF